MAQNSELGSVETTGQSCHEEWKHFVGMSVEWGSLWAFREIRDEIKRINPNLCFFVRNEV